MKKELIQQLSCSAKDLNLLYVEDDETIQQQTLSILNSSFDTIFTASNGEDALCLYEKNDIDLVITDIVMPRLNGLDLSKILKMRNKHLPIMITTAFDDPQYLLEAIQMGIDGYVVKPMEIEQFFLQLIKITDTINLKKENQSLQSILNQYKEIVDESVIVSKTDPYGKITYVNDMFIKVSGYTKEELLGSAHNIIRHPDMPKSAFKELWETIKAKKTWKGKVKNRSKNGRSYTVQSVIKPILDQNGNVIEYIALRDDITELENLKEQIKSEKEDISTQLHQYTKAIYNATIVSRTDTNGIITYANDRFAETSGYSKEELVGSKHSIIKHPDTQKSTFVQMWNTITKGKVWNGVLKNRTKDNKSYWVKCSIFPILNKSGDIVEYMSIRQDITQTILLHEELEDTQRELLYRMGDIAEKRSEETGFHVKRVAEYSKILAHRYGLSQKEIDLLFLASPMHDIGKVAIGDEILKKPDKLSHEEFEIMKTHSMIGYELLKGSQRPILQVAAIVAKEHHEKWDGTGYPEGKSGEDIHIYGRITALADVFDALGSDRYYKKAWPLDEILEFVKNQRGKHFEPKLVDLFFESLDEFIQIKEKYQEVQYH